MPKNQIVTVGSAAPNPNLSATTRFGNLVFVSGQTGRHPVTGEVGKDNRERTRNFRPAPPQPDRYDGEPVRDAVRRAVQAPCRSGTENASGAPRASSRRWK